MSKGARLKGAAGFTRGAHLFNLEEAFDTILSIVASDATLFHSAPRRLAEAGLRAVDPRDPSLDR